MAIGKQAIANRPRNFYNDEMRNFPTKSIFICLLLVSSLAACSENKGENSNADAANVNQNHARNAPVKARDDVEDLAKIINLPRPPEEATYAETDANAHSGEPHSPAPNQNKIVAVLKFSDEDAAEICAAAEKYKPSAPSDIDAEMWFPPELIAKSQESGDEALKGIEYAANDFLQPPYTNGKLRRVNDTDYFVLELTSF